MSGDRVKLSELDRAFARSLAVDVDALGRFSRETLMLPDQIRERHRRAGALPWRVWRLRGWLEQVRAIEAIAKELELRRAIIALALETANASREQGDRG